MRSWIKRLNLRQLTQDATIVIVPLLAGFQMLGWLTFIPSALSGHSDFRQLYTAGYMVRVGEAGNLYDNEAQKKFQNAVVSREQGALPFIRPAYQALLFVPFSLFKYRTAYLLFLAFNVLVLGLTFYLLRAKMSAIARCWKWLPILIFPAFLPVCVAMVQGQDSIILLAMLASAVVYLDRGNDFAAGLIVGFGVFKPQIVLPIALLFLVWRRWRFVAGSLISGGVALILSLLVIGPSRAVAFVRSLFSVGGGSGFPLAIDLMANLRGLIFSLANGHWPSLWIQVAIVAASALTLLIVARSPSHRVSPNFGLPLAITASVTVSYYAFVHDLCYLIIPIVLILDCLIADEAGNSAFRFGPAMGCVVMLAAPMLLFIMPSHFYLVSLPVLAFLAFQLRFITEAQAGA